MGYFDDIVAPQSSYFGDILNPPKDDRTLFGKVNDWMIDAANSAVGLARAGVSLVAPESGVTKSLSQFIQEGQNDQSDYRKQLRQRLDTLISEAKDRGETGVLELLQHKLSNPLTELAPEVFGNLGVFGAAGRVAGALGGNALGATTGLGAAVGAGGVREGYADSIMKAPDARLMQESADYRALRESGLDEQSAKTQLAQQLTPEVAGASAVGGLAGAVAGRLGAETALFGRNPGFARTVGAETASEFGEGAVQQAAQNVAVQTQMPSQPLMEDVLLSGAQEALIGAPGGAVAGAVGRRPEPVRTPGEILAEIGNAPDVDTAIQVAGRMVDEALATAADRPSDLNRMTDEVLKRSQSAVQAQVDLAGRRVQEQQQDILTTVEQARQEAMTREVDAAYRQQAPAPLEDIQVAIDRAGTSGEPNAMQLALMRARERDAGRGRDGAGVEPAVESTVSVPAGVRADTAVDTPSPRRVEGDRPSSFADTGINAPLPADVRPDERATAARLPDGGGASPVAWTTVGVESDSRRMVANLPAGTRVRGPEGEGVIAEGTAPPGRARVTWAYGTTVSQPMAGLQVEDRLARLKADQPEAEIQEVTKFPSVAPPGALSQKEADLVRQLADTFGKKVVFFNLKGGKPFNGAVLDGDNSTIYINQKSTDAHHLVVAGHEVTHLMRRDAPDLYDALKNRLAESLKEGNLANFSRYYNQGETSQQTYARLRDPKQLDRLTEEFVADLVGNRAGELRTWQQVFSGAKEPSLIQRVGKFLIDFIDSLLARTNFKKFATDKMVKDLTKARADIRKTLTEYAKRQDQTPAKRTVAAADEVKARSMLKPPKGRSDALQREGQEGALKSTERSVDEGRRAFVRGVAATAASAATGARAAGRGDAREGELGTLRRPDGNVSTEISITVTDRRLNGGRPTNIPTLVRGQKGVDSLLAGEEVTAEQEEIAIRRAVQRVAAGQRLPSFDTIRAAEAAAQRRSDGKSTVGSDPTVKVKSQLVESDSTVTKSTRRSAPDVDFDDELTSAVKAAYDGLDGATKDTIRQDAYGVFPGKPLQMDMSGNEAEARAARSAFAPVRRLLKDRYGETVTLWRADVEAKNRSPDAKTAFFADEESARQYARGTTRVARPYVVNVDDIEHGYVGPNGKIHQFAVRLPEGGLVTKSTDRSSYLGPLDAAQEAAAKNIGAIKTPMTAQQRMAQLRANLGLRVRQGLVDQFAAIREVTQEGYIQARMSKNDAGPLEAMFLYGKPFMRDGVYDVKVTPDGGFAKVLADLKGEHDRFFLWVAAQRAERLKAEGKENLFTDQDISALKTLNKGREPRFAKALKDLTAYNESVLKIAMDSGLIDQDAYDLMKDQIYVPFYRVLEDDKAPGGPRFSSGLKGQYAFKKLKGGKDQLNQDLLENVLRNWSHLLSAAAKNRAMNTTVSAAEGLGIAYAVSSDSKGSVKFMRDGITQHYMIEDPYLFEAVSAVEAKTPGWMKPFSDFKRILTIGVTASPTFKIRNLIRDSLSAIGQSDLSANPLKNVAQGIKATDKKSQTYASMLASGGVIRFGSMLEGSGQTNRLIEKASRDGTLLNQTNWQKLRNQVMEVWDTYNDLGDRAENANRAALYEQLIAKGKTHAEASFMARDLMDFSMSGRWEVVRFLAQTVPFLNARLVGLDKLQRSARENPRRMAYMVAAVSAASIALAAAYGDDEDWKQREDWDRDAYWAFKVGGMMFRIPKPFEIGAMGTLAERTFELMVEPEMTGKRYRERLSAMFSQTFSMSPVPQIVKPFVDIYANKDSFTGRAIESMGMERLRPQDRVSEGTSTTAKFLGQLGLPDPGQLLMGRYSALSPVQVDSLIRGYFGWLGVTTTAGLEYGLRPLTDAGQKPSMKLRDVFLVGNFVETLPANSSRYVTQFYEQAKEIEQAYASYRDALKRGDTKAAREIMESEREKLVKRAQYTAVQRRMTELNSQARVVSASKIMPADVKRQKLDQIAEQRNRLAEAVSQR